MSLTIDEKRELVLLDREIKKRKAQRRLFGYTPYPKQLAFHAAGATDRERLLMAGNQLGKTWSAGFETAMHLTGRYPGPGEIFYPTRQALLSTIATTSGKARQEAQGLFFNLGATGMFGADVYPDGWQGKRFDYAIKMWAGSVSSEGTRGTVQKILIGEPAIREEWGTGAIPRADLLVDNGNMDYSMASGTADLIDQIQVKHVSGDKSLLQLKHYSQGREKWQGATLDVVWFDEEPPLDIYMEGLTRTNATNGIVYLTFTPLLGMSEVVRLFISSEEELTKQEKAA
jgi:phage terminase large subunit-like protein